ncbi:hypothetical protein M514_09486 [Trichuris suis]|uniref:Uncharacterized protein n=1 Tax=Trichuris suis TaxID=68888 RepID=A0A085LXF8_9BILA|nr:hypothetical protein M513_09486 [Trichuris suis]KFD66307.1 hypothetical protein M514_09486 [Trichuris suis]
MHPQRKLQQTELNYAVPRAFALDSVCESEQTKGAFAKEAKKERDITCADNTKVLLFAFLAPTYAPAMSDMHFTQQNYSASDLLPQGGSTAPRRTYVPQAYQRSPIARFRSSGP